MPTNPSKDALQRMKLRTGQSGSADFQDDIKHQGRNVLPQNQFFDAANGYVYTVYGVNSNWKATRAGSAGMAQTAVQTSNLPTTLAAVQALTYS